jgi:SsrA-binding protein
MNLFSAIINKKANFEYEKIETYTAGIVLSGMEVKSICQNKVSLVDSFCFFENGELFAKDIYVNDCDNPKRHKKLLLKSRELKRLEKSLMKGLTIVPLRLFYNERRKIKLEIALVKGKKIHDKKIAIKMRDLDKDAKREINF